MNGRMLMNDELERICKEAGVDQSTNPILSRHFPGRAEENHEKTKSE
jgi:hypothetical protein